MHRTTPLAIAAILIAPGLARAATVECSFGADAPVVFSYDPAEGDANSGATVQEGDRLSTVLVQTGPGIVSFLDMPSDGRIIITSVELEGGKAVTSSHGARDGHLVASQRAGQCKQSQ